MQITEMVVLNDNAMVGVRHVLLQDQTMISTNVCEIKLMDITARLL